MPRDRRGRRFFAQLPSQPGILPADELRPDISACLGVSIATLRRRLQAEGLPAFRELRDRALNQAARTLLERRTSPGAIAEQLGFSDFRSFSRAFKRWNGVTPAAFARMRTGCA